MATEIKVIRHFTGPKISLKRDTIK